MVQAVFSEDMSYYRADLMVGSTFENFSCTKHEDMKAMQGKTQDICRLELSTIFISGCG